MKYESLAEAIGKIGPSDRVFLQGAVATQAEVRYVVTEYGVADLYGRTLGEHAARLVGIAHPECREGLSREWREHHR